MSSLSERKARLIAQSDQPYNAGPPLIRIDVGKD
ncbi:hypothetical protein MPOCJGCO_4942 [Methylobacterium trifolii]|uniref:Uncharacterized protein n=1 Tax=Methylobacterium trifolii TaxID=1003092 RepID=A0ABQ4U6E6_9HYPH|nr:hypothetical protein MPOCJGCO_4942 [Methylobacterium trifolii]